MRYLPDQKQAFIKRLKVLKNTMSIRKACKEVSIPYSTGNGWLKGKHMMVSKKDKTKLINHPGPKRQLDEIKDKLLPFFHLKRKAGFLVSTNYMVRKASSLSKKFRIKSPNAKKKAMNRFLKSSDLSRCRATHYSHCSPEVEAAAALKWSTDMRKLLCKKKYHPDYVLNMDETGVEFGPGSKHTWEPKGSDFVYARTVDGPKARVTACLTIAASGKKLKLFTIFKGAPKKTTRGATQPPVYVEVSKFPKSGVFTTQKGAWIDKVTMKEWVHRILWPYAKKCPRGKTPLLLLDNASAHVSDEALDFIDSKGIEVVEIPPGCTGYCQPVDIGCAGEFKKKFHERLDGWFDKELDKTDLPVLTCRIIADCLLGGWQDYEELEAEGCWHHAPHNYY
jgi:transposase